MGDVLVVDDKSELTWKEKKQREDAITRMKLSGRRLKSEFANKPGFRFKDSTGKEYYIDKNGARRRVK